MKTKRPSIHEARMARRQFEEALYRVRKGQTNHIGYPLSSESPDFYRGAAAALGWVDGVYEPTIQRASEGIGS